MLKAIKKIFLLGFILSISMFGFSSSNQVNALSEDRSLSVLNGAPFVQNVDQIRLALKFTWIDRYSIEVSYDPSGAGITSDDFDTLFSFTNDDNQTVGLKLSDFLPRIFTVDNFKKPLRYGGKIPSGAKDLSYVSLFPNSLFDAINNSSSGETLGGNFDTYVDNVAQYLSGVKFALRLDDEALSDLECGTAEEFIFNYSDRSWECRKDNVPTSQAQSYGIPLEPGRSWTELDSFNVTWKYEGNENGGTVNSLKVSRALGEELRSRLEWCPSVEGLGGQFNTGAFMDACNLNNASMALLKSGGDISLWDLGTLLNAIAQPEDLNELGENVSSPGQYFVITGESGTWGNFNDFRLTSVIVAGTDYETGKDKEEEGNEGGGSIGTDPTCESEFGGPFGWLICAGGELVFGTLESMFDFVVDVLKLDFSGSGEDTLESIWSSFRYLASGLVVIAFLLIIYSAATGNVLSSYDVKKTLPRLFIAVLGVILSFQVVLFLLRVFNDIGEGIEALMLSPVGGGDIIPHDFATRYFTADSFDGWVGTVLSGLAVAAFVLLGFFILIGSLIGVLLLWFVFILRNIGITVLIVLAPIAFALLAIPSTANMFKTWWKWLIGLLALYPMMVILLASGRLVSSIWTQTDPQSGGEVVANLVALAAMIIPYYVAPKALQLAGGTVGALGGVIKGMREGGSKWFGKEGKIRSSEGYQRMKAKAASGNMGGKRTSKIAQAFANPKSKLGFTKNMRNLAEARGVESYRTMQDTDTKAASLLLQDKVSRWQAEAAEMQRAGNPNYKKHVASKLQGMALNDKASWSERRAAVTRMTIDNNYEELGHVTEKLRTSTDTQDHVLHNQMIMDNIGSWSEKAPHLYKGIKDGMKNLSGEDITKLHKNSVKHMMTEVESSNAITEDHTLKFLSNFSDAVSNPDLRGEIAPQAAQAIREFVEAHDGALSGTINGVDMDRVKDIILNQITGNGVVKP